MVRQRVSGDPTRISAATRRLFLQFLLKGASSPPSLWAGLSTSLPTSLTLLSEAVATELKAPGYARIRVQPEDWDFTPDGLGASTERPVFRNGADETWPLVASIFLAAGDGDDAVLVLWSSIGAPRLLMPRDILHVPLAIGY